MADVDIAELRRLMADATPGPLSYSAYDSNSGIGYIMQDRYGVSAEIDEPDATFWVALVNAAPALLDGYEAMAAENARLRRDVHDLRAVLQRIVNLDGDAHRGWHDLRAQADRDARALLARLNPQEPASNG